MSHLDAVDVTRLPVVVAASKPETGDGKVELPDVARSGVAEETEHFRIEAPAMDARCTDTPPAPMDNFLNLDNWSNLSSQWTQSPTSDQRSTQNRAHEHSMSQVILSALAYDVKVVDYSDLQFQDLIGAGANMTVYKGTVKGRAVALKKVRPHSTDSRHARTAAAVFESVDMEIKVMSDLFLQNHENVATLDSFSWSVDEDGQLAPVLIMELACPESPTLSSLIEKIDIRDFTTKAYLISDIVCGLASIHSENIVHGDLKPDNILLFPRKSSDPRCAAMPVIAKITDFGFCDDIDPSITSELAAARGTEYWNAPECLLPISEDASEEFKSFPRHPNRDMYSFGLVAWYILSSSLPFGPESGPEWEDARDDVLRAKLAGEMRLRYQDWSRENLQMSTIESIAEEEAEFERHLSEELEFLQITERMIQRKIRSDELFRNQVIFDELLFRDTGKVCWVIKSKATDEWMPCTGYLPVMVPVWVANALQAIPTARLNAEAALPMCAVRPDRKPVGKIYDYKSHRQENLGTRRGWDQSAVRFRFPHASSRKIQTFTPEMRTSLLKALHAASDGPNPLPKAASLLSTIYVLGNGVERDMEKHLEYAKIAIDHADLDPESIEDIRAMLMLSQYMDNRTAGEALQPEEQMTWATQLLCNEIPRKAPESSYMQSYPVRDNFETLLRTATRLLDDSSRNRFFQLCLSAYVVAPIYKKGNRSDALLYQQEVESASSPEIRGQWVPVLLSDNPVAFDSMVRSGILPQEINPENSQSMDGLLFLMAGMQFPGTTRDQAKVDFLQGLLQETRAHDNLMIICAEHGLVNLTRHLIAKYNIKIDKKLSDGFNVLQQVLAQGREHRAIALLSCGADIMALAEKGFVEHICGSGDSSAIDFWAKLRDFYEKIVSDGSTESLLQDPHRHVVRLFHDEGRLDLEAQSHRANGRPVSPIYFAINYNTWSTFIALLRYGIDPSKPCMSGSGLALDVLEVSVVLVRPLMVATLLSMHKAYPKPYQGTGDVTIFHLASLGKTWFKQEKPWVYGNEDEVRGHQDEAQMDESNHQLVILELLFGQYGEDIDLRDDFGVTPFLLAVLEANLPVVKWFEGKGVNRTASAIDGTNALHLAVLSHDESMVKHIMETSPNLLMETDLAGQTPLHFAISQASDQMLQVLLPHISSDQLVQSDQFNRTLLHQALYLGQCDTFLALGHAISNRHGSITLQATLNSHDAFGLTCFHLLCRLTPARLDAVLASALQPLALFDPNAPYPLHPARHWTHLHYAVVGAPAHLAAFARPHSLDAPGPDGRTPLHLARHLGDAAAAAQLAELGASHAAHHDSADVDDQDAGAVSLLQQMEAPVRAALDRARERAAPSIVVRPGYVPPRATARFAAAGYLPGLMVDERAEERAEEAPEPSPSSGEGLTPPESPPGPAVEGGQRLVAPLSGRRSSL